jgi:hypothetical protein
VRTTDGAPPVRLGEGSVAMLSRDKQWVLASVLTKPPRLMLYPVGPGESRRLDNAELETYTDALFFSDGANILVCGNEPEHASRCYARSLAAAPLRPITPEGTRDGATVSPDGQNVLALTADGYRLYPVNGGAPRLVPGLTVKDIIVRWNPDGSALWLVHDNEMPMHVEQFDIATGRRSPLLTLQPARRAGVIRLAGLTLADDPRVYSYVARGYVSRIFVVKGIE